MPSGLLLLLVAFRLPRDGILLSAVEFPMASLATAVLDDGMNEEVVHDGR